MISNSEIVQQLHEMALLLELKGDNPFRIRAYEQAARILGAITQNVAAMADEELKALPGIGAGMVANIRSISHDGVMKELAQLRKKFPEGLLKLLKVQGLGPRRAKRLYENLGIDSVEKLKKAAEQGKLRKLEGFGEKIEKNILQGIETVESGSQRTILWEARFIMRELLNSFRETGTASEIVPAGSLVRGKDTVGDLDILAVARDHGKAIEAFTKLPQVERVMGAGDTKATVWLKSQMQCDLRVVDADSFGAAMLYFTGSKEHNVALRERALKLGFTINEYGLFKLVRGKKGKKLAGKTEKEIYKTLGLDWIPPELRENRGEIEAAEKGKLPKLIEMKDIKGDFHNHTNLTDGSNTFEEMAEMAHQMGWEWIFIGDHSQGLRIAHGLTPADLHATIGKVRGLDKKSKNIRIFRSMEVDILKDGSMDYEDKDLEAIDAVVASVHNHFNLPEEEMTKRIQRAADNPHVDIIGHLSGRLLNKRSSYAVDAETVLKHCAKTRTALEINGQPQRQEIVDSQAKRAKELGAPLALTTDAHSKHQLGYMELALTIARRAWLRKEDVINSMSATEIQEWLRSRRHSLSS